MTGDRYVRGERVVLVFTSDPYTHLRPGDTATVLDHRDHTVHIRWDSGSGLAMCLDAGDQIERLGGAAPHDGDSVTKV